MKRALMAVAIVVAVWGSADAQDVSPVVHEGIVEAPLDAVWAAWTTSEGLRSWMAPHAEIDLRVGGRMRANYNAQGTLGDRPGFHSRTPSSACGRSCTWRPSRRGGLGSAKSV